MAWDLDLASVGSLISEPARCRILLALGDGRALPASTLAREARVAASTATGHLYRLVDAGWLQVETHGRHRFYRLVNDGVGEVLEAAARIAPPEPVRSLSADLRRTQLRDARTCYGHLAGRLGVGLLQAMLRKEWVEGHDGSFLDGSDRLSSPGTEVIYRLTTAGAAGLGILGVTAPAGHPLRHCVDWSEQRHHLGGRVARGFADRLFELGWLSRATSGRAVTVTEPGRRELHEAFGI